MRIHPIFLGVALLATAAFLAASPSPASAQTGKDKSPEALQRTQNDAQMAENTRSAADVDGIADPAGDVPYCQGDITSAAANIRNDFIAIGHQTACGSNPSSDAAWTLGSTVIIWSLDLNSDGDADYEIFYSNFSGLRSAVYFTAGAAFTKVCDSSPSWDGSAFFSASFPASCVGTPAAARFNAYMVWDENPSGTTCSCPYDVAPDHFAFSQPIARSDCSATTAAAGTNALPTGSQGFTALNPTRIYDTRTGVGGTTGLPLGSGQTSTIRVTGVGGVPSTGVSAVVLNVTATLGTKNSYLSITPDGGPGTSSVNFKAGQDMPNLVTVPVAADGNVRVFNSSGCVHVVLDVFGYYGTAGTSMFNAVDPARILDTRTGTGGVLGALGPDTTVAFYVGGRGGVPAGAAAAVLNVTATEGTLFSYLSVTPLGGNSTSNVNFVAGQDRPNLVTVPLASDGTARIYNAQGAVHVVADVMGWYGPTGSLFTPVAPARIVDTRLGTGGISGKLPAGQPVPAQVSGVASVPTTAEAVVLNMTGTEA